MYKNIVLTAGVLVSLSSLTGFSAAHATANDAVCKPLDSGKIDLSGDQRSITVTAPEGKIITGYCVKAGSTQQGNGPKYISDLKTTSATITHPSGKAISHYSLSYGIKVTPSNPTGNVTPKDNDTQPANAQLNKPVDTKSNAVVVAELPKTGIDSPLLIALSAGATAAIVISVLLALKQTYFKITSIH